MLSSKASGEPPMALGAAVALAVRDAMRAARAGKGNVAEVDTTFPLTVERAQLGCSVSPADFVLR